MRGPVHMPGEALRLGESFWRADEVGGSNGRPKRAPPAMEGQNGDRQARPAEQQQGGAGAKAQPPGLRPGQ